METKTLAIVGCGKLASIVLQALDKGLLPDYKIIGTYSRTFEKAQNFANFIQQSKNGGSCIACCSLQDLLDLKPDYIAEIASPDALKELVIPALKNGSSIVTLSIGGLADAEFYELVKKTASENRTRVHIASGAIGGFDVLRTVSLMESSTVTFDTTKGPRPLRRTPVYDDIIETETRQVFEGNAVEAITLFPHQVNVSVAAALASTGPENVKVSITSVPDYVGDKHRIAIKSQQVHAVIDIYSQTAQIAGWSIVNTLRNITAPIAF
ncbi:aspartate dehydrogenase [Pseudalgibacter alginicilyticus]|uniref:L-aspartate dehydrogenase n=1 Tax=Pseudalgibacter alginicilyticus TaxID=1736674 RepID=A0A0P0CIM2_9FLAO|nr:aspartate dehydrogenase domain-containing protein [Pseudalgibacter alginicilyticus]ALJ06050.1 aspartate dehydrogenase [Pseudalgibacter alginicilyticus]